MAGPCRCRPTPPRHCPGIEQQSDLEPGTGPVFFRLGTGQDRHSSHEALFTGPDSGGVRAWHRQQPGLVGGNVEYPERRSGPAKPLPVLDVQLRQRQSDHLHGGNPAQRPDGRDQNPRPGRQGPGLAADGHHRPQPGRAAGKTDGNRHWRQALARPFPDQY